MGDLRKASLDLLRFPLAIVVVIVHVFGPDAAPVEYSYWYQNFRLFHGLNQFIDAFLRGISVPIYFFISGFVFFLNTDFNKNVYVNKLKNRVKTLLVPYLIWNAAAILLVILKQLPLFSSILADPSTKLNLTFANIVSCFWKDNGLLSVSDVNAIIPVSPFPINASLWFIRDLMLVVIASPLIYWVIKRLQKSYMLCIGMIYIYTTFKPDIYGVTALFFFSWGACFSINRLDIISCFRPYFKASLYIYILLGILFLVFSEYIPLSVKYIKLIQSLIGLVLLFNLSSYLLEENYCKINSFLSSSSFFIYVTHCLLVHRVTKILLRVFEPVHDISVTGVYILSFVSTVSVLIFSFYILKRYFPRLLVLVTGRR